MPQTYKVLGQAAPAATTDTTLYTVPASTEAVLSSITVANRSTVDAATYRVAVRPGGASLANQHYVGYDVPISAAETTVLTLGLTVSAGDVITVRASTADVSFGAFGVEIEP